MGRVKFGVDGVGEETAGFYDGPPPVPGTYTGKVKRMELSKTGPTSNKPGSPLIKMVVEITGPKDNKFIGAGIWHNLNPTKESAGFVNNFLNALAGPSEAAQLKMQKDFWNEGPLLDKSGVHFLKIGQTKIDSPEGEREVAFVVKKKTYKGETGAAISRFLIKKGESGGLNGDTDDDADDGNDIDFGVVDDADLEDDDTTVVDEPEADGDEDADGDVDAVVDNDVDPEDDTSDSSDDDGDGADEDVVVAAPVAKKKAPF